MKRRTVAARSLLGTPWISRRGRCSGPTVAPGQDGELLKDDAAVAPRAWHGTAVHEHGAARGRQQPARIPSKRGFPAAARPDHGEELALRHVEVEPIRAPALAPRVKGLTYS